MQRRLAAAFPQLGIGFPGASLAFGLTVLSMAYAVGHISGGHFDLAATVGLRAAGRSASKRVIPYIVVQTIAAVVAVGVLSLIASGKPGRVPAGFASNGYGEPGPGEYPMGACLVTELVPTFLFLLISIGTTSRGAATGFAGIPIGLALTLIHRISIPVTNTSVDPARGTGPALMAGGATPEQFWLFWLAPRVGAASAGAVDKMLHEDPSIEQTVVVDTGRVV